MIHLDRDLDLNLRLLLYLGIHGPLKEGVVLKDEAKDAFETLKRACLEAPMLAFADLNKPSLLETDVSKLVLGAVLSQKQADGQYHLVPYTSQSLTSCVM